MTDIILHNLDGVLADRIRRVAETRGWSLPRTALYLIENGLFAVEAEMVGRFDDSDAIALQQAIAALEGIPSDPGFSKIGRAEPVAPKPVGPDLSGLDLLDEYRLDRDPA
ncbi:hypothetical protein [Lysobacter antibioticus]|uniref:hypothetical protein n=1 Tax=Lysobacter antibioticus TaxID=84531 RepID=UPI00034B5301|nr:hypothetical protein [Lysobacter antibioticus]